MSTFIGTDIQVANTGIRSRSPVRRSKDLDAAGCCHTGKMWAAFAIIVPNQVFGSFSIHSGLAQLLRYPEIRRSSRHLHMDDLARFQCKKEEGKKGTEEETGDL